MKLTDLTYTVTTPPQPGAVAIVQVMGQDDALVELLDRLCTAEVSQKERHPAGAGRADRAGGAGGGGGGGGWPVGRLRLQSLAGIDEGLAGRIDTGVAQLMPHGGLRVVQKVTAWLVDQGVEGMKGAGERAGAGGRGGRGGAAVDSRKLYPEAGSRMEADLLDALAKAASPAAVDVLAAQPRRWRQWLESNDPQGSFLPGSARSYLIRPAVVAVVGRPNAGKSTLLNQLTGRPTSVVADRPGTTRDWVSTLVELTPLGGDPLTDAVAVRWTDTPGLRASGDAVEQRAIHLARQMIEGAEILIVMRSSDGEWPDPADLPGGARTPDLWVVNRVGEQPVGEFSAECLPAESVVLDASRGEGVSDLVAAVFDCLEWGASGPLDHPWAFSPWLDAWAGTGCDPAALRIYLGLGSGE